jgi:hypothetical protein
MASLGLLVCTGITPAPGAEAAEQVGVGGSSGKTTETPSTELEVGASVGEAPASTGFGCSSRQTRLRYVVGAAEVRHSTRPLRSRRGTGWSVVGGTAFEFGEEKVVEVVQDPMPDPRTGGPAVSFGAHARGGYHARWVGAEVGVGVALRWQEMSWTDGWALPYPDVRLSVGPRDTFHFFTGLGNSSPTSMAIGLPYAGLGWAVSERLRLEGRVALEVVHAAAQWRSDLSCLGRIAPLWSLRAGFGFGAPLESHPVLLSSEGNLSVVYSP